MSKRLLVIEAHSDDSSIGSYGLIRTLINHGYEAFFLVTAISDVSFNHGGVVSAEQRLSEYENYVSRIGGRLATTYSFDADSQMDTVPIKKVVSFVEHIVYDIKPDTLICQAPSFHQDHTITYKATVAALRPTMPFHPSEFLLMENPTYVHSVGPETDFRPTTYCPMSEDLMQDKIDCFMSCFPSQIRTRENCLSPEGIRSWAKYRALECYTDKPYAEAFVSRLRRID